MGTLAVDKLMKTSTGAAEFILPATDGTANQVMQTDGSGQLSFATISSDPTMGGDLSGAASNAQIVANAVGNTEMADDAVGVAELSATGTASATTYLRGDNSWATVSTDPYGTYSASIRKNANQSVPNNTSPECTFEVTVFDTSPSTNMADLANNRIYFRGAGMYFVIVNTNWGSGASNGQRYTYVRYYDSSAASNLYLYGAQGWPYMNTGTGAQFWTSVYPLNIASADIGDYVSMQINQNCGQAVNVQGNADYPDGQATNLAVVRIE